MDSITIENLRLTCIIGCYPEERVNPQTLSLTLTLFCDTRRAAASDQLADAIDYDALSQKIRAMAAQKQRQLLEALAEDIASLCLRESDAQAVTVQLRKPGVPAEAAAAVVTITRTQNSASTGGVR
ncbi:dihydroneopterin aldolase [Oligosphaera ethanolica]|uniref:7,8-dihydroneopterin aldolase n=1 Tax=Oligosphaera ethanolica TaxID=760260 RepID=A0AAE3VDA2_9BACT|nr:dihydroneopterin aldolase [Oligosphaera ethanolica]MDQ0288109.1 dihydroneopterin aldolase [Oligosphaera ethanolica]